MSQKTQKVQDSLENEPGYVGACVRITPEQYELEATYGTNAAVAELMKSHEFRVWSVQKNLVSSPHAARSSPAKKLKQLFAHKSFAHANALALENSENLAQ
jgi:hypothetical protein